MKIISNNINFKYKNDSFLKASKILTIFLMSCWFLFLSNSSCSGERTKDLMFYIVRVDLKNCNVNENLLLNNEHVNKQFDVKCKNSQELYIKNINNKEIPYKIDILCKGNEDKDLEDLDKLEIRINEYYHYIPFHKHDLEENTREKVIYDFVNNKINKIENISIKNIEETSIKECTIILFKKAL